MRQSFFKNMSKIPLQRQKTSYQPLGGEIRGNSGYTSYSKMAANELFFCLQVNKPSLPHFHFKILLFLFMLKRLRGLINMQTKG